MSHIVKCRICRQSFDTAELAPDQWCMPSRNYYYHSKCYNDWKQNKLNAKADKNEIFWYESLIDYLYNDLKMNVDFSKLNSQWQNFIKPTKGYTPKGIYFAIRYYYDVLKGDITKAQGGIGIVGSIYRDSAHYWTDLEIRKAGTLEAIIEQIKNRDARPVHQIIREREKTKNKTRWNLDDI